MIIAQSSVDSLNSRIEILAKIEKTKVPLNRTIQLYITLSWMGGPDRYSIISFDNPVLTNFDIVGTSTVNRSDVINQQAYVFKDYVYTLQPRDLGMAYVEGVIVKYRDSVLERDENMVTQRIPIEVIDPLPEPVSSNPIWIYALIIIVILGFVIGFYFWFKRRREAKEELEIEPPPPLEEVYLNLLREQIKLDLPNLTEDFASLSKLIRRYLTERFKIQALEGTTDQLLQDLHESDMEEHQVRSLKEVLTRCDEIKFSAIEGTTEELNRFYTLFEGILQYFLQQKETTEADNLTEKKEK